MTNVERRFTTAMREADSDDPGLIQEDDGTVWLVDPDGTRTQLPGTGGGLPAGGSTGEVLTKASNADGDADWEAGGGSQPITRAEYDLTLDGGNISWAFGFGTALFDLTSPIAPTPVVSGVYSIAAYLTFAGADGSPASFGLSVVIDNNDFGANLDTIIPGTDGRASATLPFYCPAGSPISIQPIGNFGDATISGRAWVQRLS